MRRVTPTEALCNGLCLRGALRSICQEMRILVTSLGKEIFSDRWVDDLIERSIPLRVLARLIDLGARVDATNIRSIWATPHALARGIRDKAFLEFLDEDNRVVIESTCQVNSQPAQSFLELIPIQLSQAVYLLHVTQESLTQSACISQALCEGIRLRGLILHHCRHILEIARKVSSPLQETFNPFEVVKKCLSVETIKLLIDLGADSAVQDRFGCTACKLARDSKDSPVIMLLGTGRELQK